MVFDFAVLLRHKARVRNEVLVKAGLRSAAYGAVLVHAVQISIIKPMRTAEEFPSTVAAGVPF